MIENSLRPECCEFLPWDTDHFGLRIGRVAQKRLTPELVSEINIWASANSIRCLYLLADPEPVTMNLAAGAGFRVVDFRVTLEKRLSETLPAPQISIRPFQRADLPSLSAIAMASHHASRFYMDGNLPEDRCDDLFRIWIERSCAGDANMVFVAESDGAAVGYATCHLRGDEGNIGLVAVAPSARGRHLALGMIQRCCAWFQENGADHATVVTQGANTPATRLYQRCGFLQSSLGIWYHR
jgi:dTDP-4-amino-4,6-dideoxy-D-galactose acyltransferase